METGQVAMSLRVLDKLLDLYEATDEEREALRKLAKEGRKRGWWHTYSDALLQGFDIYLGLESEASSLWFYQPEVVPGLLQTEEYVRALTLAEPRPVPEEEMAQRIASRMRRQERLTNEAAATPWVILHESVLRHEVGGITTMVEQLQRLESVSREGLATIQVLPFSAGAHPAMHSGGFAVMSIPMSDEITYDIAYVEHRTGGLYLDKAAEVNEHKLIFDHLRAKALDREESRVLISEVAQKMTSN